MLEEEITQSNDQAANKRRSVAMERQAMRTMRTWFIDLPNV
jgi:hypothetical protein